MRLIFRKLKFYLAPFPTTAKRGLEDPLTPPRRQGWRAKQSSLDRAREKKVTFLAFIFNMY